MSICNRLVLQTLGSQPVVPKNLTDHCVLTDYAQKSPTDTWVKLLRFQKWSHDGCQQAIKLLGIYKSLNPWLASLPNPVCNLATSSTIKQHLITDPTSLYNHLQAFINLPSSTHGNYTHTTTIVVSSFHY